MNKRDELLKMVEGNIDLLMSKGKDYGNDNINATGIHGVAVRLVDKVMRLKNLTKGNHVINHEGLADTAMDIANYGIILQQMLEGTFEQTTNTVYLGGPIDNCSKPNKWREWVSEVLASRGIATFNPFTSFMLPTMKTLNTHHKKFVDSINRSAILNSDIVLINLYSMDFTIGSIREIEFSVQHNKKLVVVIPNGDIFVNLHDTFYVNNIDGAISYILNDPDWKNKINEKFNTRT